MKHLSKFFSSSKGKALMVAALIAAAWAGLVDTAMAGLVGASFLTVKAIESQGVTISYSVGSPSTFASIARSWRLGIGD